MRIDERDLQWVYTACALLGLALALVLPSAKRYVAPENRLKYAILQVLTLVGAVVGAKVAFLVGDVGWPRVHVSMDEVIFSGKSITGGLLGGFLFAEVGKVVLAYGELPNDGFAAKLPLSIAVGRVGCVFSGCCRGVPRDSGLTLTYSDGVARFPAQLWELGFQLVALSVLVALFRKRLATGRLCVMTSRHSVGVVIVACGGGGLISGVAAAIKQLRPSVRVIGVEPTGGDVMTRSLAAGSPQRLPVLTTIADGLAAPFAGTRNLAHCQAFVDEWFVVPDEEIVDAMKVLMERCKLLPEAAGAAALVPLLTERLRLSPDATVVPIVCGGNVDLDRLKALL